MFEASLLILIGLVAGLIDSIAGGGGLITVPYLTILLGPGSLAIGTNKVAATCAAGFALLVYARAGHVRWRGTIVFTVLVGLGSLSGAAVSPHISAPVYKWILIGICPMILWVVYKKDFWARAEIKAEESKFKVSPAIFWFIGFFTGFYDGIAGPGGGTLMFLSLYLIARFPLLMSMATAKIANLTSASLALASFSSTRNVDWSKGFWLALGISLGAVFGAQFAHRHAAKHNAAPLARAALLILATILLCRLL